MIPTALRGLVDLPFNLLAKIGVVAIAVGMGLGTLTIMDFGSCADECHGYAIPVVIAAMLVLAGSTALLVAVISGNLRRQLTPPDR